MILCEGKYVALVKEEHWEFAHRLNATGAAVIVAVTSDQKLLLVEQRVDEQVIHPSKWLHVFLS